MIEPFDTAKRKVTGSRTHNKQRTKKKKKRTEEKKKENNKY